MSTVEALEAEAEKLSAADRSRLLERLVARLDVDPDIEAEWEALADRRGAELDAGTVEPVSHDAAISRFKARFPG